jgi:hypothetical protein
LLLRMLGPHMWLQLALPDKLLGQAAQRLHMCLHPILPD